MAHIDFKKLYHLQDEILKVIFQKDTEFYLTGGTCLNRFYFENRYSDDLDLFTHFSNTFSYSAREIIDRISRDNYALQKQVDSKDFIRIQIMKNNVLLQVDFVNDRVKRFGDFRYHQGYKLDNPLNILSNKITAVMGRDNPKDIFDICLIARNMPMGAFPFCRKSSSLLKTCSTGHRRPKLHEHFSWTVDQIAENYVPSAAEELAA